MVHRAHTPGVRVLHVFSVADIGGAEAVSLNIIRFREDPTIEHTATVVNDDDGPLERALATLDVPVMRVPRGRMRHPGSLLRAATALRRVVRELQPDVLLANSAQAFLYARLACVGMGLPVAVYYMAVPERRLWRNSLFDVFMMLGRPTVMFTASRTIGALVAGWGRGVEVLPVYHGTPLRQASDEGIQEVERELRGLGIAADDPVVLLAGRLQPWKGQQVLIEAFPAVRRAHPNAHAVILGGTLFGMDVDYPDRLRALIARLSLSQCVHVLGHRTDVRSWIERANVVVHASTTPDAFPNVCIEALAARRPLITNRAAGTREIVEEQGGALVTTPGDASGLAVAITAILGDGVEAAAMAERGFRCYEAHATPGHMVRPIEATLARIARSDRGSKSNGAADVGRLEHDDRAGGGPTRRSRKAPAGQ